MTQWISTGNNLMMISLFLDKRLNNLKEGLLQSSHKDSTTMIQSWVNLSYSIVSKVF